VVTEIVVVVVVVVAATVVEVVVLVVLLLVVTPIGLGEGVGEACGFPFTPPLASST
jgi:hypothetical protein